MRSILFGAVLCTVVGQLFAQSRPVLGSAPFNGLRARVTGIQFFEGGPRIPDPKQRVVTTKFDAFTTRFIYFELELAYAAAAKPTAFQIDCQFAGPNGVLLERRLAGSIEKGWTGSYHAAAVGSPERGQWTEGTYRVTCKEEEQVIVSTQLELVKSAPAVGKLGAAIVQMKLYQSLAERAPVETRRYATRFDARTARWIKTEFALVYPQVAAATAFSVECAYVFPDKSVKRVVVERQIPAGWTGSVHVQGIQMGGGAGGQGGGGWPVGKYSVSCWSNGEKMAERAFEVFDSGTPARDAGGGGRLRFYPGKAGSAADPAYAASFALGSYDSLYVEAAVPVRVMADSASFGCTLTDPAGITSEFGLKGSVLEREKQLVARGPIGTLEPPRLRGSYRVECRTGRSGVASDRFAITGPAELPALDVRLVSSALYAGEEEPGDEAVPDVLWSAAKFKSFWLLALFDHPTDTAAGTAGYSCRVTGARNAVLADSGPQSLSIAPGDRAVLLRQKLSLLPRQRWTVGKYTVRCISSGATLLQTTFDLTR